MRSDLILLSSNRHPVDGESQRHNDTTAHSADSLTTKDTKGTKSHKGLVRSSLLALSYPKSVYGHFCHPLMWALSLDAHFFQVDGSVSILMKKPPTTGRACMPPLFGSSVM